MNVSGRPFRMLFEAALAEGIAPESVVRGLPYDVAALTHPRHRLDWETLVTVTERLYELVGRDPERLERLGERMLYTPSFAFLRRMARLLVTPAQLVEVGNRWVVPTVFPDMTPPTTRMGSDQGLFVEASLPANVLPCEPFWHIYLGNLRATPTLLGLPPALVEARVSPRRLEATLHMPVSHTLLERARRSLRMMRGSHEAFELLDAQRRTLEEEFAASIAGHRNFKDLLDNLPTLVLIHRDGNVLWVNRTFLQKLGLSRVDEIVGRSAFELLHASSHESVRRRVAGPATNPVDPRLAVRMLRRDGTTIEVEVSPAQVVQFGGGEARLVVGVDVTERAELEQRLITADRIAAIGRLGAGVAHEINNPLTYALSSVELAAGKIARLENVPAQLPELLATALEGLGRVRTIVHDLRALSRADDGIARPTDVREVLDSTLTLAASALASHATVVREYREVPPASATGPRLGQVALNLVLNAVESMAERGGERGELHVRTLVDGQGRVTFEVADTGMGIPADVLPRIFDPFFTTKPIGRGTGLGLAICHQIVTGFGGEISVTSTVGSGSTFRVSLPRAP